MMATWPVSLPQSPLFDSYQETTPSTAIRSEMSVGPDKSRPRTTAVVRAFRAAFRMTTAQVATFETFFYTTIAGGSGEFDFPHPRTGSTVSVRIVGDVEGPVPISDQYYTLSMTMEIIPSA